MYTINLGASGWANNYYSAAVQAGTKNLEAAFFGSLDASNYITVDKPPLSLWVMELSARTFGVNSWSILVPNAIEGVLAVLLLGRTIRRWFGPMSGITASVAFALTPAAALMFRYNNPESLLTLLLVTSAYAITRAIEHGSLRWLLTCGALLGLAFLTKYMEAFVVVPAFGLAYLVAAPPNLRTRIAHLCAGFVALVIAGGWWVAIAELWPAHERPYYSSSKDNSVVTTIFGSDGINRLEGSTTPNGKTLGTGTSDLLRLFNHHFAAQASWLLPLALIATIALLWTSKRNDRTDKLRAATIIWGGWLVVTMLVLSISRGIIHPYYTVVLAPAIAALAGIALPIALAMSNRNHVRLALTGCAILNCLWVCHILFSHPTALHFLPYLVIAATLALVLNEWASQFTRHSRYELRTALVAFVLFAAPLQFVVGTIGSEHGGVSPIATGGFAKPPKDPGSRVDPALVTYLRANASHDRWAISVFGSDSGAPIQLATDLPVMSIGGFAGSRYSTYSMPLAKFQQYAHNGQVHFYMAPPNKSEAQTTEVNRWVTTNFESREIGGRRIYDLTRP